jgi:hypothetical protein
VNVTTDDAGFAQINLIRFGIYECTIQAKEDYVRCVKVPDAVSASLPDLLFPLVSMITFDTPVPTTYEANGDDVIVTPSVKFSDGNDALFSDVQWSSSDSTVLSIFPSNNGTLTLRPRAAGSAEIRAVRSDNSIIRIPDPGITGVPISVVVT